MASRRRAAGREGRERHQLDDGVAAEAGAA